MSELLPHGIDSLDGYMIEGRSLREWHAILNTDPTTGEYVGELDTPCSRYGRDSETCAWYALAAETVYVAEYGADDADITEALDYYMQLCVNDHPSVAEVIYEYWHAIPHGLRRQLGPKNAVERLLG